MNEPAPATNSEHCISWSVFISYATADRKQALSVCKALERRGTSCWISCRDVEPGANYQEEIVRAIRTARAMVLVFSEAANNSDEIKKELSLGSRHHIPVMALRIEDVEPSDAFAYELSTRQWIDAFEGWDSSLDALVRKLEQISPPEPSAPALRAARSKTTASALSMKVLILTASVLLIVLTSLAAWMLTRPTGAAAPQIRLASFDLLSTELPASLSGSMHSAILSAFAEDGQISVSTASTPPRGTEPAYALGGSIRRNSDGFTGVVARLTNERTGMLIWSHTYWYPTQQLDKNLEKVPRWFAVDANGVVKCGLLNASTYPKRLPEEALRILFEVCTQQLVAQNPIDRMDLRARKLVRLVPDFSAAWSNLAAGALSNAALGPFFQLDPQALTNEAKAAAAKAIQLDPKNSQAYVALNDILPPGDLVGREALLKKALAGRPLACGCEHASYGEFLQQVGRIQDSLAEFRAALDIAPLQSDTEASYATTLMVLGRKFEADGLFLKADSMTPVQNDRTLQIAYITGDYGSAPKDLKSERYFKFPLGIQNVFLSAYQAISGGSPAAKEKAAAALAGLPEDYRFETAAPLGALGANGLALKQFEYLDGSEDTKWAPPYFVLWYPSMDEVIRDPSFPTVAQRLGLMKYWKVTRTKPDVCSAEDPPPFCAMI